MSRNVAKLVRVPSPRYKVGQGLSVEQVRRLLEAAKGHRLYPLFVVAATMGLRRGELVGLRWADVDMERGTLRVQQTVQRVAGTLYLLDAKTEDSEGILPLPDRTWRVLVEHRGQQAAERAVASEIWQDFDLVFPSERGTPVEPTNLSRAFARLRETAGLPGVRLHDLTRSYRC